ncbi:MAG: SDR family oxidoreductase [Gloeobacteraceae cyanobacterium ES-bin-316]|nr:SDR family oxidoreductase [Ferruginibacter sp.]
MIKKILVTGATGTIGKALVAALKAEKVNFVAGVRNKTTASQKLGADVMTVSFDFEDPATYEAATDGVDAVFLLGPPLVITLDSLLTPFIDFLKLKDIKRVVYVGSLGMEKMPNLPFHVILTEKLKKDGFEYTILKPSFFAQNFKNYEWENIVQRGITYSPAGNGKVAFVDVADIAGVAAKVLTEEGHIGKEYEITGPETLSYEDAAGILSAVTKKPIVYPNPSAEEYTVTLKSAGAPDFIAPYMISVYSLIANNEVDYVSPVVEQLTGKKPNSLRTVLEKDFG